MAGSLIKNPGGGLAKIGGYIVGRKELVEACSYRMTSPGIGAEAGASLYSLARNVSRFLLGSACSRTSIKRSDFYSRYV